MPAAATLLRWARNAPTAARDGGAGLVVLNGSTRLPPRPTGMASFELRREAEAVLREAGPPCVVLRPPLFMDNLANPAIAGAMVNDGVLTYPMPEGFRVAWLAAADLGGFVAAALRRPDLAGRAIDVGGPEGLDGAGLVRGLSPALGQPLRYVTVPPDAFERALCASFPPAVARGIAETYFWIAENPGASLLREVDGELARELSRPAASIPEWARFRPWPLAPRAPARGEGLARSA